MITQIGYKINLVVFCILNKEELQISTMVTLTVEKTQLSNRNQIGKLYLFMYLCMYLCIHWELGQTTWQLSYYRILHTLWIPLKNVVAKQAQENIELDQRENELTVLQVFFTACEE